MKLVRLICQFALCLLFGIRVAQANETGSTTEILLGMSTVLNGPAADLGKDMQRGFLAGLERVNRGGGVHGRNLRLIALDDGYEPARTAPNMRRLIEKERVLAVIGNVGTPTAIAARPIADEQKTLFFAPFTGGETLRNSPPDRYIINFRASYAEETAAMIDALVSSGGIRPEEIAFFTQQDAYSDTGFAGSIAALKRHGLRDEKAIIHVSYERNTLAVENAVADLLLTDPLPRAVIMVGAYAPSAKFIKLCREAGLDAIFLNVSFVGSNPLARELDKTDARVIVTQVVPYPFDNSIPILHEYQTDLKSLDPSAQAGFGDFEGYIAARIFALALDKIAGSPTREAIIDALEGLGQFDIGLGEPLHLSSTEHQASHRVWPTTLQNGAFVPFEWNDIASLLPKRTP
jgi:branched-chain amino acid transport system substrate-binding protein